MSVWRRKVPGGRGVDRLSLNMIGDRDLLAVSVLELCWAAEDAQYASYPVIREQTPEDLDWVSTRDNSEILDLIALCMTARRSRANGWGRKLDGTLIRHEWPRSKPRKKPA